MRMSVPMPKTPRIVPSRRAAAAATAAATIDPALHLWIRERDQVVTLFDVDGLSGGDRDGGH